MKKIPTLFIMEYGEDHSRHITDIVRPGMEWVLRGEGTATVKMDGSACAIINGELYRRYDAKAGKTPPEGAIPCCDPDPVTGHWPHWVKVTEQDRAGKWQLEAFRASAGTEPEDGTYEAMGPHFQNNPYGLDHDVLERHGIRVIEDCPRDGEGIREYLRSHDMEGIVFWKDGQPQCKIRRKDFGFPWPMKNS